MPFALPLAFIFSCRSVVRIVVTVLSKQNKFLHITIKATLECKKAENSSDFEVVYIDHLFFHHHTSMCSALQNGYPIQNKMI